ncbi:acetylesterase [Ruania alkalisoli]|uniref:Acetylesterase n=1 Tax=Ruania alkalisoli TaxID=2779775 RepID=A0A7M1SV93_9MICO|nr:acetylesterase [Ruania alkalisoli]QOR71489.1 acetylesterase [Ruania alkalisoli]
MPPTTGHTVNTDSTTPTEPTRPPEPAEPADLAGLSGLLDLARSQGPLFGSDEPSGAQIRQRLIDTLGVWTEPAPPEAQEVAAWTRDGVTGVELEWDTGVGPPARGRLLRPAGETGPLPGAVVLHCHGGVKYIGKEKVADGPDPAPPAIRRIWDDLYGGRAVADDLARRGYTVLAHDAFGWGSRRIPVTAMPARTRAVAELQLAQAEAHARRAGREVSETERYDAHAGPHEDAMAKLLGVLGTSWGGMVAREDLIAVDLLARRADVRDGGVAVLGLSGGGARAALLTALSDQVRAAAVLCMMAAFEEILDGFVHTHTWMMMNPGIGRVADWPGIAAAAAPRPLLVGYGERDALFPVAGMRAAHEHIAARYEQAGAASAYRGVFLDAPHAFVPELQARVWEFLDQTMR